MKVSKQDNGRAFDQNQRTGPTAHEAARDRFFLTPSSSSKDDDYRYSEGDGIGLVRETFGNGWRGVKPTFVHIIAKSIHFTAGG
jgi:hypothetical protein